MKYLLIILGLSLLFGCNDEEILEPTTKPEFKYTLPQGEHDYDNKIVQWYQDCGFYILYKFEDKDVFYNESMPWAGFVQDTLTINESVQIYSNNGISINLPDEEYVGLQLEWIEDMLLKHYSKELLRIAMPKKLILGKELSYNQVLGNEMIAKQPRDYYTDIANTLIFSHGDASIHNLDNTTLFTIKNVLHKWLLNDRLFEHYPFSELNDFFAITDYSKTLSADFWMDWEAEGWITGTLADSETQAQQEDIKAYIEMIITTPKELLELDVYSITPDNPLFFELWDYPFAGYLHESIDISGNIKKKYNMLISVFKNWGVDLETIGNLYHE